jgi:hypothetical protein
MSPAVIVVARDSSEKIPNYPFSDPTTCTDRYRDVRRLIVDAGLIRQSVRQPLNHKTLFRTLKEHSFGEPRRYHMIARFAKSNSCCYMKKIKKSEFCRCHARETSELKSQIQYRFLSNHTKISQDTHYLRHHGMVALVQNVTPTLYFRPKTSVPRHTLYSWIRQ